MPSGTPEIEVHDNPIGPIGTDSEDPRDPNGREEETPTYKFRTVV